MSNPNETDEPQIDLSGFLKLLSPAGQLDMIAFVQRAREERGAGWLDEIKADYPLASWVIELVCTRTDDEALGDVAAAYPKWPVRLLAADAIKSLHRKLKYEIERPRDL